MAKLTMAKAKAITKAGFYRADDTLYLQVTKTGSGVCKSWVQRLSINRTRHDIGLGSFKLVDLTTARHKALENRVAVLNGKHPLADKHKAKAPTFQAAAQEKYKALADDWKNDRTGKDWMAALDRYVMPRLGIMCVDKIGRADVLAVLEPIWHKKPPTARKVRRAMKSVFEWCEAHGYIEKNYAGAAIDGALSKKVASRKQQNHKALPYAEVPAAIDDVRSGSAAPAVKACIEFAILTACRSGEARGAVWSEIDLEKRLWTIPGERMKQGKDHRQPLSDQAIEVLNAAKALRGDSELVFPSPQSAKTLCDKTLNNVLVRIGLADRATMHGFRTSFRTWASEQTNADHAVMELCLSHAVGDQTERAYARSDLLEKRARLMAKWGTFAAGGDPAKVVQLHG